MNQIMMGAMLVIAIAGLDTLVAYALVRFNVYL